ncbi:MAG TPA: flavohemoglobin expression-modulating QEGLA motif protein [Sandaracinaceae bacterium LLY-WYZ-13_1]|nr:flavohemoglobin expression-modulating QEGLA motif protein [Sandaracinaceae bacterium LLY-WYZ-13_1]
MNVERARALNDRLVDVAPTVRVLSSLSWPEGTVQAFLDGWRRGSPRLPTVEPTPLALDGAVTALDAVAADADPDVPLERFVADTARSYATAARMLGQVGTPAFTTLSRSLYGGPDDRLPGAALTHRDAARRLLDHTDSLTAAGVLTDAELCLTADHVQGRLRASFDAFFGEDAPRVEVDPDLASKAAAGATRVRLRDQTCFSELDVAQLTEHEGFVHSATKLNGRAQPLLTCLGLGAPRTTATQEGLATFAELTTRAIDIARLRRLALRTVAIHHALEGADYVEVFRFFLEAGQSEDESAHSAMRVFRGGDVRGGIAFTKDVVYLDGLIAMHTFLRKAIAQSRPHLVRRLFAGRLTLRDVLRLDAAFADGQLAEPRFVPAWATDLHRLAADLAFAGVLDAIDLGAVALDDLLA